ncbi:MAG TPA: glycosyltransferase family 2 protein [Bacteroidia bacterium]|jgi:GT2 family glycosyltransferase|nr:glycosyltransferase family 2 protein [Bacteroidia bacterium]
MLKLGVIIPTFNRKSYLKVILKQLLSQEKNDAVEIIPVVVVDGSNDGTYEMLQAEFPAIDVVKGTGKWWWTKSVNEGVKHAVRTYNPEYILLLNDDSLIQSDYITSLFNVAKNVEENSIIGSISVTDTLPFRVSFSGVKKINWYSLKKINYYKSFELLENTPESGIFPTYALNGRGTLLKSSTLIDLNLLDEVSYPQYGSDDDLALRAWKKGYKVYVSYSCRVFDRTTDTSKGTAFRKDSFITFFKSFFKWNSVNYIPKELSFSYRHGIKILLPFYFIKFILGTNYAYFFKYRKFKQQ